jgi:hypothetical protein
MFISIAIIGWICLIVAILMTLFYPLGQLRRNQIISQSAIFVLWVIAAYILIPYEWVPQDQGWKAILIGVLAGLIALLIRNGLRVYRFFTGKVYRVTRPYYWYNRALRGISSRRRRRRQGE